MPPPDPAAALYDPELREWPAPAGILSQPEGLRASFEALRMGAIVESVEGSLRFEAWRTPRASGAAVAALAAIAIYLVLDAWGVSEFREIVAIVLAAWYIPSWLLPAYRISGKIEGGSVQVRITGHGVFAQRGALERKLRFYLDRS